MKKTGHFIWLGLLLNLFSLSAQTSDVHRNKGFFNISKISFHNVHRADEYIFTPSVGTKSHNIRQHNSMAFGIETITGWFLNPYISAGIGFGYNYYNVPEHHMLPVFVDLRTYFSKYRNSFYANLGLGPLFSIDKKYTRAKVVNAGVGYKFFVGKNVCLNLGLVANAKDFNMSGFPDPDPTHEFAINSVSFDLGIVF
jgi:hypothetical protein